MASITKTSRSRPESGWHNWAIPISSTWSDVEGSVGLDLGVYGAPETYVLDDASGRIAHRHVGVLDEAVFQRDFSRWFRRWRRLRSQRVSEGGQ